MKIKLEVKPNLSEGSGSCSSYNNHNLSEEKMIELPNEPVTYLLSRASVI